MVFQVQEETWLDYQEIQGKILCERGCTEENVSWTLGLILPSVPVVKSEFDIDLAVYPIFQSQIIDFKNDFSQADIPSGEPVFIEIPRDSNINGDQNDVVIRLKKILYGQAKATHLWCENLRNGLLDNGFVVRKVDPRLFMSTTVICVIYMDDYLFWARSQYDISIVMKYFREDGPSYKW